MCMSMNLHLWGCALQTDVHVYACMSACYMSVYVLVSAFVYVCLCVHAHVHLFVYACVCVCVYPHEEGGLLNCTRARE